MAVIDRFHLAVVDANPREIEGDDRFPATYLHINPRKIEGVQRFTIAPIFVADNQAPVLDSAWSPSAGTITAATAVILPLKDTQIPQSFVAAESIWVEYGSGATEQIFDGMSGFMPLFSTSFISSGALRTQHVAFTIQRNAGWSEASTTIWVYAIDQQSNSAKYSIVYTISDPTGGGGGGSVIYKMMGTDAHTSAYDTWFSPTSPDYSGVDYMGGLATPLRDVAILAKSM